MKDKDKVEVETWREGEATYYKFYFDPSPIYQPHPPYIFNKDGNMVQVNDGLDEVIEILEGYLHLCECSNGTATEVEQALNKLKGLRRGNI